MYYKTFYKLNNVHNYTPSCTVDMLYANLTPTNITGNYGPPEKFTLRKDSKDSSTFNINQETLNLLQIMLTQASEISKEYSVYRIAKSTGGYRTISAPNESLKNKQRDVYNLLHSLGAMPHDAAYAYIPQRTCKDAVQKHQQADNKWFYKFDIKDFFPTCTTEILKTILKQVYPFCSMPEDTLDLILDLATYNNALPQGSPLSPLLSNMVLTPFDFIMHYSIRAFDGVYTRYADDILISTPTKHDLNFIQRIVQNHLTELSPNFRLNVDKARCGSKNGSNWNLGLMLNKENNITIGHKKKMILKAKINNFILDFTNSNYWSIIDTQVLQGEVNYFKTIEPEYANFVIQRLEQKYQCRSTLAEMFSAIISGRVQV